jgi:hypothetical protein
MRLTLSRWPSVAIRRATASPVTWWQYEWEEGIDVIIEVGMRKLGPPSSGPEPLRTFIEPDDREGHPEHMADKIRNMNSSEFTELVATGRVKRLA